MRLIDADAQIVKLREEAERKWFGSIEEKLSYMDRVKYAIDRISEAPTIEAEPVKRGEWKIDDDDDWGEPYCTKCGCIMPRGPANFCPNCGAHMKEE